MKKKKTISEIVALAIMFVLMILGFFLFFNFKTLEVKVISSFLIVPSLYIFIVLLLDKIVPPKEEVLYLLSIEDEFCCFLNKKGRYKRGKNNGYKTKKFYKVLYSLSGVIDIISESNETFCIKESYWGVFHAPFYPKPTYNYAVFPLLFILFIFGIYTINIFFSITILLLFIYDLIYKIRKKRNKDYIETYDLEKYFLSFLKVKKWFFILLFFILNLVIMFFIFKFKPISFVFIPFLIISLSSWGLLIFEELNKKKFVNFFRKIIIFMFYGGVFTIFAGITCLLIKNKTYLGFLFVLPFFILFIKDLDLINSIENKRLNKFINEYLTYKSNNNKIFYEKNETFKFITKSLEETFQKLVDDGFAYYQIYKSNKKICIKITFNLSYEVEEKILKEVLDYLKKLNLKVNNTKSNIISLKIKNHIYIGNLSLIKRLDKEYLTYELDNIMNLILDLDN